MIVMKSVLFVYCSPESVPKISHFTRARNLLSLWGINPKTKKYKSPKKERRSPKKERRSLKKRQKDFQKKKEDLSEKENRSPKKERKIFQKILQKIISPKKGKKISQKGKVKFPKKK